MKYYAVCEFEKKLRDMDEWNIDRQSKFEGKMAALQSIQKCLEYLVCFMAKQELRLHRGKNSCGPGKEEALLVCLQLCIAFCQVVSVLLCCL
jgi:hypothetical protein